jgi:hypothetical protein
MFTIEIDCAPGATRPSDLFPAVLAETGLEVSDFSDPDMAFGNFSWNLINDAKIELYKEKQPLIAERITNLFKKGVIRYGSW